MEVVVTVRLFILAQGAARTPEEIADWQHFNFCSKMNGPRLTRPKPVRQPTQNELRPVPSPLPPQLAPACCCSAGWSGRAGRPSGRRARRSRGAPTAPWCGSCCGTWRRGSGWPERKSASTASPTAPWDTAGWAVTRACVPSSRRPNGSSWSTCAPG